MGTCGALAMHGGVMTAVCARLLADTQPEPALNDATNYQFKEMIHIKAVSMFLAGVDVGACRVRVLERAATADPATVAARGWQHRTRDAMDFIPLPGAGASESRAAC